MNKFVNGLLVLLTYFLLNLLIPTLLGVEVLEFLLNFVDSKFAAFALVNIIFGVMTSIVIIYLARKKLGEDAKEYKKNLLKNVLRTLSTFGLMYVAAIVCAGIMFAIGQNQGSQNQEAIVTTFKEVPLLMAFLGVVIAPIIEEITFRYGLRNMFKNDILFLVFASVSFGFIHVVQSADYIQIIPYIGLGVVLSWSYLVHKNIYIVMITHAMFNGVSFIVQFFADKLI